MMVCARIAFGIGLTAPLLVFSADGPISLDELSQRASLTEVNPVVVDGKRLVSEMDRVEEVANHLCEQFGGRLKTWELDFDHPVGADEMVSYHDGMHLRHYRLDSAEEFTAFKSVVCVGLVLRGRFGYDTWSGTLRPTLSSRHGNAAFGTGVVSAGLGLFETRYVWLSGHLISASRASTDGLVDLLALASITRLAWELPTLVS